jgi:23S rRNA pseudouridine2605 synthase
MSDDRKKSPGKRGPGGRDPGGRGAGGKPGFGKSAPKKGDRPASYRTERTPRPTGASAETRGPRRDDKAASADAPKKAYKPREPRAETPARPEGRTFRKSSPGERPFASKTGERPFRKPAETGDKREYRPRRDDAASASSDAPKRAYRPRPDGERPFRKPAETGDKREYRPRRDDAASASSDAPKRAYRPRPDGDRPFRKPDGDRPFRKRADGDAPRPVGRSRPSEPRHVRDEAAPEEGERIAKRLARAGISSRRDAEEMIAAGRVRVNGKILASPAVNVGPGDIIHVDNELIPAIERTRLFLFHKPGGLVTTNRDPEGRRTVFDVLPEGLPRLVTIGRLDINTEGLLLLTNDGGLARVLELPATGWLRRYRVRVHGRVDEKALAGLKDGIAVDGVFYGAIEATLDREQGSNAWLTIGLREGKNREVKNVLGALGLDVSRLIRISYGPFQLGDLAEGAVQELKGKALRDQLGERMIEESGANFEAPIVNEFSNRPVTRSAEAVPEPAVPRHERRSEPGEGGLIKNRKRSREAHREDVLGRLGTKPDRPRFDGKSSGKPDGKGFGAAGPKPFGKPGGKPGGKAGGRTEKPFEPPKTRSANVWMAPGARPQGKKNEPEAGPGEKREGRFRSPSSRPAGQGKARRDR